LANPPFGSGTLAKHCRLAAIALGIRNTPDPNMLRHDSITTTSYYNWLTKMSVNYGATGPPNDSLRRHLRSKVTAY
jgi:hypothetical protein